MLLSVGQEAIRELISAAAAAAGIVVPASESDAVAWVVNQAVATARERAAETRNQISQLQEDPGRLSRALRRMDDAYARLLPMAPGDEVTGQHLRLVVADLLERRFSRSGGDWAPDADWKWAADGALSTAETGDAYTRAGLVAAVRFLTDYAKPYGHLFAHLIAHMLGIPLQVLSSLGNHNFTPGGGPAQHTVVLVDQHYLATRTRSPVAPASTAPPTTTAQPPADPVATAGQLVAALRDGQPVVAPSAGASSAVPPRRRIMRGGLPGGNRAAVVTPPGGVHGRSGDGVVRERQWAPYGAQWQAALDRLANHAPPPDLSNRPDGFPADRAEAFDVYAQARARYEAAAGQAGGLADAAGLREQEAAAAARLQLARGWLAAWGIADAEQAWQAAQEFSATRATGLSAAGRRGGAGRGGGGRGRMARRERRPLGRRAGAAMRAARPGSRRLRLAGGWMTGWW